MKRVTALGLFSGGLDSILACRVLMAQGIRVIGLKFVTPFFDDRILEREDAYRAGMLQEYGIDVRVVDLGPEYVELLEKPRYGYGRHFNPCVDCKIFMLRRARALMPAFGASFLFTGEVLGQRPMSQRRDTLRIIERDSGCGDILLRPLCALRLRETAPEREGMVDRERLYAFSGRGRRQQMELASAFGITEYPSPAGGCILTDPNLGRRIDRYYSDRPVSGNGRLRVDDIRLLLCGRQFYLPGGYWLILGRNQKENEKIHALAGEGDWLLTLVDRPGPTGLLRRPGGTAADVPPWDDLRRLAAGLVVRFGKKMEGRRSPTVVRITSGGSEEAVAAAPLDDELFAGWRF